MNYKRGKPQKKGYRNSIDGWNCPWCGSNWLWKQKMKKHLIEWELDSERET